MQQLKLKTTSVLFIALIVFCSCSSTKNIEGVYRSNFATEGFFITKLTLKLDSTFGYRIRGDLLSDTAKGKYRVVQKSLLLKYDKPILEKGGYLKSGPKDSTLWQAVIVSDRGPRIYRIGHRKLFEMDSLGHKQTRANGYSKHKRFWFWGDNYLLKRKYFLKKI